MAAVEIIVGEFNNALGWHQLLTYSYYDYYRCGGANNLSGEHVWNTEYELNSKFKYGFILFIRDIYSVIYLPHLSCRRLSRVNF